MIEPGSHSVGSGVDAVAVMGVRIDPVTNSQTLDLIDRMVRSRHPHHIVTANLNFLAQSQVDVELRRILLESHLVLCDGTPLLWVSKWLGNPIPERVAGSDLVPQLVERSAQRGYRLFFLGSTPEIVARCVTVLKTRHPTLPEPGLYAPPFADLINMDHEDICARVRAFAPDILLVAMGCPKQEKWIAMHLASMGVPVAIGIGATIDFLAGHVARAPVWMRRTGTEWLFRVAQEPRRLFRRYFTDFFVVESCLRSHLLHFRHPPRPGSVTHRMLSTTGSGNEVNLATLTGHFGRRLVGGKTVPWGPAQPGAGHWLLDLSAVESVDIAGMGLLCGLWKDMRTAGRQLVLVNPSRAVRDGLRLMCLEGFFAVDGGIDSAMDRLTRSDAGSVQPVTASAVTGTDVLCWHGEITSRQLPRVWELSQKPLLGNDRRALILDLAGVGYLDSAGVGLLRRLRDAAISKQRTFQIRGACADVENVLKLARWPGTRGEAAKS